MQPEGMRTSRVVALAFLVGLFFVVQEALVQLAAGRPVSVANDVEVVLRVWAVWALLAQLVVSALRRCPLETTPLFVPIVAHVSVAVVLAVLQSSISIGLEIAMRQDASPVAFTAGVFTGVF